MSDSYQEGYDLLQYLFVKLTGVYTRAEINLAYPSSDVINQACGSYAYQVGGKGYTIEDMTAGLELVRPLYQQGDFNYTKVSIGKIIPLVKQAAKTRMERQAAVNNNQIRLGSGLDAEIEAAELAGNWQHRAKLVRQKEDEENKRTGLGNMVRKLADGMRPGDVIDHVDDNEQYDSIWDLPGVAEKVGENRDEYLFYGDPRYGVEEVIRDDDDFTIIKVTCENVTEMIKIDWSKETVGSPKNKQSIPDLMRKELGIPIPTQQEQDVIQSETRMTLIRARVDKFKRRMFKAKQKRWEREEVKKCERMGVV